ncbi:MAG: hypothetical protein HGA63_06290 [Syntrophobacteraceae bacterium]|nr:hypothetical protein [Syntrophobacteraceae bacterium]
MEKKIFVKKGQRIGGGRSYIKVLMWSAVALIIIVLLIPFSTRKKGGEPGSPPKQAPDKGVVFKEMPKSPPTAPEVEKPSNGGVPGFIPFDKSPEAGLTPETKTLPEPPEAGKASTPPAKPPEASPSAGKPGTPGAILQGGPGEKVAPPGGSVTQPGREGKIPGSKVGAAGLEEKPSAALEKVEGAPATPEDSKKKLAMVKPGSPKAPKPAGSEEPTPGKPSAASESLKPGDASGKTGYAVQVGSFKDKSNAEDMRKNLEQKGYKVQIRPRKDPKLGQLFVVQLAPVENASKASTLAEQIRREDKVQPFVVKVGPEE